MCAVNGATFEDRGLIERMIRATAHRGPDGTGVFSEPGVALGHARLAILDASEAAAQPMEDASGRYVISYNGEVYNFRELKEALRGYPFRTSSDTEAVLAAYAKWGRRCVEKLEGIFAFAVWDRERKELFLARDRCGVKPLHYAETPSGLVFSSEIGGVLEHPEVPRTLDPLAFECFLRVLYVPEPLTAFAAVRKFPAAHRGVWRGGSLSLERYWDAEVRPERRPRGEWKEAVRSEVERAVRSQLVSDRPVGMYLSGGIDSTVILDVMSRQGAAVDAFSAGFILEDRAEEGKFNADLRLAERTAARYGARHHELLVSSSDAARDFEDAAARTGDLVSNPTAVVMFALSRFAKKKVAVALGGDGGDELFGGYDRYRYSLMSSRYRRLPATARAFLSRHPLLSKLDTPPGIERWWRFHAQKDGALAAVLAGGRAPDAAKAFFREALFPREREGSFEPWFMDTDRRSWLADHSLLLSDRMSMAHGLELRVPLLDTRVVELALRIPAPLKIGLFRTKAVFKEAFRGRLPDELFRQPKRGWFSPGAKWLREKPMRELARELLSPGYHPLTAGLFDWKRIEAMLSDHVEKRGYHLTMLWALMTFQAWARAYRVAVV